jgi:hypothetical protein
MAPPPNRVRVHRGQTPRAEGPILPSPDTRGAAATSTNRHFRILCLNQNLEPSPNQDLDCNLNVVDHNISIYRVSFSSNEREV